MGERIFMLELQERLSTDPHGELRRSLIAQLQDLQTTLLARRRLLNEPEVYHRIQAALGAVEAALGTLRTLSIRKGPSVGRWRP